MNIAWQAPAKCWRREAQLSNDCFAYGAALTVIVESPVAMKDALAVLSEDLRAAIRVRAVQCMRHQLRSSGVGLSRLSGTKHGLCAPCAGPSPLCAENRTPMAEKCQPSIDLGSSGIRGSPSVSQQFGAIRDA